MNKSNFELVICRYNEDIRWSEQFAEIRTVYDKGGIYDLNSIVLPNVGRDAHCYLTHIVRNYENLSDITLFFQGSINDRPDQILLDWTEYFKNNGKVNGRIVNLCENYDWKNTGEGIATSQYSLGSFCEQVLKKDWKSFNKVWIRGMFMSVPKELILKNPKEYYQDILRLSNLSNHTNPEDGFFMERLWFAIF